MGRTDIRDLTEADQPSLSEFSCRNFGEPWSDLIQEVIRERLAAEIAARTGMSAIGMWADDCLAGVAAWRPDPSDSRLSRSLLLAVQNGYRRRGYGKLLKREQMRRARHAGAVAVVSIVHWDNDGMIELNVSLGASVQRIDGDPDHCLCVIPLG